MRQGYQGQLGAIEAFPGIFKECIHFSNAVVFSQGPFDCPVAV